MSGPWPPVFVASQALVVTAVFPANVTRSWPTHVAGDIALLLCHNSNEQVASPGAPWELLGHWGEGTPATAGSVGITIFWTRATSSAMADAVVANPGNHVLVGMVTFRSVYAGRDPWVLGSGTSGGSTTSVAIPGGTTITDDTLIAFISAHAVDSSATEWNTTLSNADTDANPVERADLSNASGTGGGYGVATASKAVAGTVGTTTTTQANASRQAWISIALPVLADPYYDGSVSGSKLNRGFN